MESGEYFLKASDREAREIERRKQKVCPYRFYLWQAFTIFLSQQAEASEKRRAERAEAFVAPVEIAAPTVEEKRRHRKRTAGEEPGEETEKKRKKKRHESKNVAQEEDES